MDTIETIFTTAFIILGIMAVGLLVSVGNDMGDIRDHNLQHAEDFGLGSAVITTSEYAHLANDSFAGVVVRGETRDDPALTVRNRDGVERRIATEFLEPVE